MVTVEWTPDWINIYFNKEQYISISMRDVKTGTLNTWVNKNLCGEVTSLGIWNKILTVVEREKLFQKQGKRPKYNLRKNLLRWWDLT